MKTFLPLRIEEGASHEAPGVSIRSWNGPLVLEGGTAFGMVSMRTELRLGPDVWVLRPGSYFVSPEPVRITEGRGLAISVHAYRGLRQVGGPIEPQGRLRYIDGCSDTLVVSPPRWGEPCLNHLHIPRGTRQSDHTHASARVGIIVRGRGHCVTDGPPLPLEPGLGWYIPAGLRHAFITEEDSLDVLAWHPDSDFGPTDENHPMINRTVLSP